MKSKSILIKYFVMFGMAVLLMASCGGTRSNLMSEWDSTSVNRLSSGKIMIAGLTDEMDRRMLYENALAEAFEKKGIAAFPSYSLISKATHLNKDAAIDEARKYGIDFTLTTSVIKIGLSDISVPVYEPLLTGYFSADRNYYGQIEKYLKNELVKHHEVKLESNIYDTATGRLIWTGVSDTINPDSKVAAEDIIPSITGIISEEVVFLSRLN